MKKIKKRYLVVICVCLSLISCVFSSGAQADWWESTINFPKDVWYQISDTVQNTRDLFFITPYEATDDELKELLRYNNYKDYRILIESRIQQVQYGQQLDEFRKGNRCSLPAEEKFYGLVKDPIMEEALDAFIQIGVAALTKSATLVNLSGYMILIKNGVEAYFAGRDIIICFNKQSILNDYFNNRSSLSAESSYEDIKNTYDEGLILEDNFKYYIETAYEAHNLYIDTETREKIGDEIVQHVNYIKALSLDLQISEFNITNGPYLVGDNLSASFTITNIGSDPVTIRTLTTGGRLIVNGEETCPNDNCPDFSKSHDITLQPGVPYEYEGQFTPAIAGDYYFFPAVEATGGIWNVTIPTTSGVNRSYAISVMDFNPPDNVEDFDVSENYTTANLMWRNPENLDFYRVLIVRSTNPIIWQPTDGETYSGAVTEDVAVAFDSYFYSFSDRDLNIGETYNYKAFSYDLSMNYSSGVESSVYIDGTGTAIINADFTVNYTRGRAPIEVQFTDLSTSDISTLTTWVWDFGDGAKSYERNPTHTYSDGGTYSVSLTVSDGDQTDTIIKDDYITVFYPEILPPEKDIVAIEYFFDSDPGAGNGIPIPMVQGDDVTVQHNIDLSYLTIGLHRLYVRAKDENENWGIVQTKPVLVQSTDENAPMPGIVDLEYFFDSDPGFDGGTDLYFESSDQISQSTNIDLSGLDIGLHRLYIRARDDRGNWGVFQSKPVLVQKRDEETQAADILKTEYFFDDDPGFDNGTDLASTVDDDISLSANLDLSTLSTGLHRLYVRSKDQFGNWGITQTKPILVQKSSSNAPIPEITEVEYFFDGYTPYGSGANLSFAPGSTVDINSILSLNGLSLGGHRLFVRARDENGVWGIPQFSDFLVAEPPDDDGDGVPNSQDVFPDDPNEWGDNDLDGIGDNADTDDDNDGYTDAEEIEAGSDPNDYNSIPVPEAPDLIYPGNNAAAVDPISIEFTWSHPEGDNLEYCITTWEDGTENAIYPGCDSNNFSGYMVNDGVINWNLPDDFNLKYGQKYFWSVCAKDTAGNWGDFSAIWSFTTKKPPRIHGLFVGQHGTKGLRGDLTAKKLYDSFSNMNNVVSKSILTDEFFGLNYINEIQQSYIEWQIDNIKENFQPGDIFLLYIAGHGTESTVIGNDETTLTEGDEYIWLGDIPLGQYMLTDDELYSYLDSFDNIEKWVIVDSCHSGGFWGNWNMNDEGDLEKLPKTGMIASAREDMPGYYYKENGLLILGKAVSDALSMNDSGFLKADVNSDNSLSFDELSSWLQDANNYWLNIDGTRVNALDGIVVKETDFGDETTFTADMLSPVFKKSQDFTGHLLTDSANIIVAKANGPYEAEVGDQIEFSANGSYASNGMIALYEWEWDNDGTYDEATQLETTMHSWFEDYKGTIRLRVTEDNGQTDTDSASVRIISDPSNIDNDGDNFTEAGGDCDDSDPTVFPGAEEIPYDGIDQNCDGADLADFDGDGYIAAQIGGDDCDDADPEINPAAAEECGDGVDNNCDGQIDEGCSIPGDLNGDGNLDTQDYMTFRSTLGKCTGDTGFIPDADYDGDGCISYADYRIWYGYYLNQ